MTIVVWFDAFTAEKKAFLGGKSASLGEMVTAGLPVPPGFAITTHAFRAARDRSGVVEEAFTPAWSRRAAFAFMFPAPVEVI